MKAARMPPMPRKKLPDDERRALILAALKPGANRAALARDHDITRQYLYVLIEDATKDPRGSVGLAEDELAFRREVLKVVQTGGQEDG